MPILSPSKSHWVSASLLLLTLLSSACMQAQEVEPYADVKAELSKNLNLEIESITEAPIDGLLTVFTNRGIIYVTKDTNFVIQGSIYELTPTGVINRNEDALRTVRLNGINEFKDSAIVFKAENEKHVITVFTDTTCGFCRKMHREIEEINELGITVNYLAFPRAGINSEVYTDTVSIWCARDPNQAMTDAKLGKSVASASCENKVAEQYLFGQKVGISGTPNIVLPDGSIQPGYLPAKQLAAVLNNRYGG